MKQITEARRQKSEMGMFLVCLLFSGFCLLSDAIFAQELPEIVKTPKVHIVRDKDTLWDISKKYLDNPFKWEEVWSENKFIANPHLIYPGDNIVIPGQYEEVEVEKAEPQLPVEVVEEKIDEDRIPVLPVVTLQQQPPPPEKIPLTTVKTLASAGYIIQKEDAKGIIFDSPEPRTIFGRGDTVYITTGKKEGAKAGDIFTVYKPLRSVTHPVTGKNVGILIEIMGELEVTEAREDSSTANIIESYLTIEIGNKLKEREDMTVPMLDPAVEVKPKNIKGYIIDAKDQRDAVAAGDIVYIDVGTDAGASAGDRFSILKSVGGEKIKLPEVVIGSLQIIKSKERVSTAIISESRKEVTVGEMIDYQR